MTVSATIYNADCRVMPELADDSIDLVVTSPPYWHIKDYEDQAQIGYNQSLHEYLRDLYRTWSECHRVLKPGTRLCINIGDQFARSVIYGRYKIIPLHSEMITQAERIGFDYMGSIIWQKKTTMNTTGGAVIMGSFPHPPNGIIEIDYEYILIFKKPGKPRQVEKEIKEASRLSKEDWKKYFIGHWAFGGAQQVEHEATFPEELPKRLIRMFAFAGDTVLDPFMGSGTTARVASALGRNSIGYEINESFIDLIRSKIGHDPHAPKLFNDSTQFIKPERHLQFPEIEYTPGIQDAKPTTDPKKVKLKSGQTHKVVSITTDHELILDTDQRVRFLGIQVKHPQRAQEYLRQYILGKRVSLEYDNGSEIPDEEVSAYVYLKNRIFINGYMIKSGLASADHTGHRLAKRFEKYEREGNANGDRMGTESSHEPMGAK